MKRYTLIIIILLGLNLPLASAPQSQGDPSMIFLGASNTNTDEYTNGSYVTKLTDLGTPWTEINIINSGVDSTGAFTYYQNSQLLDTRLENYDPNIIFIMLGGNDFLRFATQSEFNTSLNWLLSDVNNNTDNHLVFVANIIWSPLESFFPQSFIDNYFTFQEIIKTATELNEFNFVDVYNTTQGNSDYYQNDFIHLNEEGHKALATSIDNQISRIIEESYFKELDQGQKTVVLGILGIFITGLIVYYLKYRERLSQ